MREKPATWSMTEALKTEHTEQKKGNFPLIELEPTSYSDYSIYI